MEMVCKCGGKEFFTEEHGNQTGLYCSACGKWQKWLKKDEIRLFNHGLRAVKEDTNDGCTTKVQPYMVNQHSIVTLRAEQLVDSVEIRCSSTSEEYGITTLNKMLAAQLLHNILNYAKIETYENPYGYSDKTLIRATMKVVDITHIEDFHNASLLERLKTRIEESAIKVSTVKAPHTYMKAVGTKVLEKILEEEFNEK